MDTKLRAEIDMLQGNINRICITDNKQELSSMVEWAKYRIDIIFNMRKEELDNKDESYV